MNIEVHHQARDGSELAASGGGMHPACILRSDDAIQLEQQEDAMSVLWWTNTVSLPLIATLGLLCNALNLLVLATGEARRMPSWHLLVSLALCDSLFLAFAVLELTPLSLLPALSAHAELVAVHTRAVLFIRMCASTFYKASILIVVAFNVERYLCVCRPLWAHRAGIAAGGRRMGARRALTMIVVALALAVACSLQWPLAWTVVECAPPSQSVEEETPPYVVVALRESATLQAYYRVMDWLCLFLFNLLPVLLLGVLNFQLVCTLRRIVRRDSSASAALSGAAAPNVADDQPEGVIATAATNEVLEGHSQQRLNANAMLFAVVLLLFICIGPQAPARLLYEWYGHYHTGAVLYTCITQQLVFLNASLNFCLYCLISHRYRALLRDTVYHIFARRRCRRHHPKVNGGAAATKPEQNRSRQGQRAKQQNNNNNQSTSSSTGASREEQQQHQQVEVPLLPLVINCNQQQ